MQKPQLQSGRVRGATKSTAKMSKDELARQIKRMRDRDAELVTGIFRNRENPASAGGRGMVLFNFKAYPGDPFETYELFDGERYELPRGVARHLNTNCFYKEYQHLPGEFGAQGVRGAAADGKYKSHNLQMAKKIHRYEFVSLEYMDDDPDMMQSGLVEVTVTP